MSLEKIKWERLTFQVVGTKLIITVEPPPEPTPTPPTLETLTINVVGGGTTDPPQSIHYLAGSKITILAIPDEGWVFKDWTYSWIPDLHTVENPLTLTLQE